MRNSVGRRATCSVAGSAPRPLVLIVVFLALWWVYGTYRPQPPPQAAGAAGGAAGLRARPQLHLGAAQPECSSRRPPNGHADPYADHDAAPATATAVTTTTPPPPFVLPRRRVCCRRRSAPPSPTPTPARSYPSRGPVRRPHRRPRPADRRGPAKFTATLACRDDHPGPCQQEVQIVGASGVG